MQPIRTGNTVERLVRNGIFTALVLGFAAYCFYDWKIGYPKDNLRQAVQVLPPEGQKAAQINPLVTTDTVMQFKKGDRLKDIEAILGEPAWEWQDKDNQYKAVWFGPAITFTVMYHPSTRTVHRMSPPQEASHTEFDLKLQAGMGFVLGALGLVLLGRYIFMLVSRAELSDAGLKLTCKPLATFDNMTDWNTSEYRVKGRIKLTYNHNGRSCTAVLDDYKHRAFGEIVSAICDRKGFENPIKGQNSDADSPAPQHDG